MPVKDLIARQQALASNRGVWEKHWQDIADLMLPRRAEFTGGRTPGQKRTDKQFDGTPMQAVRSLAAALDGLLKSKTSRWFAVKATDDFLNDQPEVKAWLEDAETRMNDAIYNPKARFLQRSSEVDLDLVTFGTGVMFIGEKVGSDRLMFRTHHLKDTFVCENADGDIDTLFRPFTLTARQAIQRFGRDIVSSKVREAAGSDEERDTKFKFMHVVLPSEDYAGVKRMEQPYASVWIEVETAHLLAQSGYWEFPYIVPRWDTSADEVYGRSPAMLALPDVQTLNQMGKTLLRAGHKAVEPPLLIPHDGLKSAVRTWPGGNTFYDASMVGRNGGRPPIWPLESGANMPLGLEMQNQTREMVWAAFFRNVLELPTEGPQMTATEILQRRETFMRVIGPTFGRLEADYTGPLIERVFNVMMRAGMFPEPPEALQGTEVRFEFQSSVARIGKLVENAALRKTLEDLAPLMADGDLTPIDNFDKDEITRDVAEANGLPQRWLRPIDARDAMRQQRAEALQAEQQAEDAERVIEGAGKVVEMAGQIEGPA